jgi:hypothetical protein
MRSKGRKSKAASDEEMEEGDSDEKEASGAKKIGKKTSTYPPRLFFDPSSLFISPT